MTDSREPKSERHTRRERIDPLLAAAGWTVVPADPRRPAGGHKAHALTEFPTENGPADYALAADGRVLGIVEAKKVSLSPQGVLTQAERYARGVPDSPLDFDRIRAPFLYSTNGEVVRFRDARPELNVARKLSGFHTPSALRKMLSRDFDDSCAWFERNPNEHPRLRPCQIDANAATEAAIAARRFAI
ncbi:MAG: hypothetical protein ABIH26_03290 [Candidatus Eisenbacteria bacterium]